MVLRRMCSMYYSGVWLQMVSEKNDHHFQIITPNNDGIMDILHGTVIWSYGLDIMYTLHLKPRDLESSSKLCSKPVYCYTCNYTYSLGTNVIPCEVPAESKRESVH